MKKNKIREVDPDLADWLNLIKDNFGIKAVAVRVGDEIIYRKGNFDSIK